MGFFKNIKLSDSFKNLNLKKAHQTIDNLPPVTVPTLPETTSTDPVELDKIYNSISLESESLRKLFLFGHVRPSDKGDACLVFINFLFKLKNPFISDLYSVISDISIKMSKEAAELMINPKFSGLVTELINHSLLGLDPLDTPEGLRQLKIIAFYTFKFMDVNDLTESQYEWKTLEGMTEVVNKLDPNELKR